MPKLKAINFELIDRNEEKEPYAVLEKMRRYHEELAEANIALAWRENLKSDKDGHLILGKCVKASDLQRELVEYDFVILLNREVWEDSAFGMSKKCALMDHELCHAAMARDEKEIPKRDVRGRQVWRVRKHDIEEFQDIVTRHGCYKADLERFAEALLKKRRTPLLNVPDETTGDAAVLQ